MQLRFALPLMLAGLRAVQAQVIPQPDDINVTTTSFIDQDPKLNQTYLVGFKQWMKDNIPFIDVPDPIIEANYYYRLWALAHHMVYTTPGMGYFISEFNPFVGYGGFFGDINAAAGHQIEEAQWLRSTWYARDTTNFWFRGPNRPHQYTHWIHYSASTSANVTGDQEFLQDKLDNMLTLWHYYDYSFNASNNLYHWTPNWDAQEYSLPGFLSWNATGRVNGTEFDVGSSGVFDNGPETYRPTINAYMFANAQVIANVAAALGNDSISSTFTEYAINLENAMYLDLWSTDKNFFMDVIDSDYVPAGMVDGREGVGFVPYRFGVGLSKDYLDGPLAALYDPNSFYTEFGPPSLETQNEWYSPVTPNDTYVPGDYTDTWDGQSWPFLTSHLMKSLATIIRSGQSNFTVDQYYEWMGIWTRTQYKNGVPYIAESHFPSEDIWGADTVDHSEHYQHSTGADLILTGFLGITPRADDTFELNPLLPSNWTYFAVENLPYHGNLMTVVYDPDGNHYSGSKKGLTIYANGVEIHNSVDSINVQVQLPSTSATPTNKTQPGPSLVNIACNPMGTAPGTYPSVSASYNFEADNPWQAIDGRMYFDENPHNRWSNYPNQGDDPRINDSLNVNFTRPWNITGITLGIVQDTDIYYNNMPVPNPGLMCPRGITITDDQGEEIVNLSSFVDICIPHDINYIPFNKTVETTSIGMDFFNQVIDGTNYAVGISEVQIWVPANYGPLYLAADASSWFDGGAPGAAITFDPNSHATSTGAVFNITGANPRIDFSGIYVETAGQYTMVMTYNNPSGSDTSFTYDINNVPTTASLTLTPTTGYSTASTTITLDRGMNFITFFGGVNGLLVESIEIKST